MIHYSSKTELLLLRNGVLIQYLTKIKRVRDKGCDQNHTDQEP